MYSLAGCRITTLPTLLIILSSFAKALADKAERNPECFRENSWGFYTQSVFKTASMTIRTLSIVWVIRFELIHLIKEMVLQTIAIRHHCSTHITADEERLELSTLPLTTGRSAIELFILLAFCLNGDFKRLDRLKGLQITISLILFIHPNPCSDNFVGPVRFELTTFRLKAGNIYQLSYEPIFCCNCWNRTNHHYLVTIVFYHWIKLH